MCLTYTCLWKTLGRESELSVAVSWGVGNISCFALHGMNCAATEGAKNGGEALKYECMWWIQDSCGTCFMLQTAMVWGSSQPRWSLPIRMGFTSWAIFRLTQSMAIISSLPFSKLEQLSPLQQRWEKKQRLVYDGLILKWLSVSSQALVTGDSCTFIFLPPLHMTDLLSH